MPSDPNRHPSSRTTQNRFSDIVERGESIARAIEGLDYEAFLQDSIRQDAVCYGLLCLSEATARLMYLDPTIPERYPEVPWHQIRGIGNVLRHGYDDLDLSVIWKAVSGNNLTDLMRVARQELDR